MRLLRSPFLREFLKKEAMGARMVKKGFLGKGFLKKGRKKFNFRKKSGRRFNEGRFRKSGVNKFSTPKRMFSTFYDKKRKGQARFGGFKKKKNFSFFFKKIRRKKVRRASTRVVWQENKKSIFSLLQRVLVLKRLNNYFRLRFFLPRFFFKFLRKPLFLYKFGLFRTSLKFLYLKRVLKRRALKFFKREANSRTYF